MGVFLASYLAFFHFDQAAAAASLATARSLQKNPCCYRSIQKQSARRDYGFFASGLEGDFIGIAHFLLLKECPPH